MSEEWRAVPGCEGLYEVSNCGRCRSMDGEVVTKRGIKKKKKGVLLKVVLNKKGYSVVSLPRLHKQYVHRLVAMAFIPNPNALPMVNHKDEDKANNRVENLEWCDNKYNLNYGTTKGRMRKHCSIRRSVEQINYNGEVVQVFLSLSDAAKAVGVCYQNITYCCKNYHRTAGGYKWRYKTE